MVYELGQGGRMHVEHPALTYGDLVELSEENVIERSDHIGNLHPAALLTVTDPNIACRQVLVDSNNGDDREYFPRHMVRSGGKIPMTPTSQGTVVVTHLKARMNKDAAPKIEEVLKSADLPALRDGDSLAELHLEALRAVGNNSEIVTNGELMQLYPEATHAMVGSLVLGGGIRRIVEESGRFRELAAESPDLDTHGVYGVEDSTPSSQGLMLPLPGILALDIIDNAARGNDKIYHQAGCDMRLYTHDERLMRVVALTVGAGLAALGIKDAPLYSVIDTANIIEVANSASLAGITSQYDALIASMKDAVFEAPTASYHTPLWRDL